MTRPEAHRIDQKSKRTFEGLLPDSWPARSQDPDYRIDYTVEVFDGDFSSGLFWNVQLKGTKSPVRLKSDDVISFPMETEHLEYYLDKVALPVFLVVADTSKNVAWWVFLQNFINSKLDTGWRTQKTATIHVPIDNLVSNTANLRQAVVDATAYMRELNPSSITAAIAAEHKRVNSLDDRFEINVSADKDEVCYDLSPKQATAITFKAKHDQASDKLIQLYESGGRVDFSDGEIDVEGFPEGLSDGYELVGLGFNAKPVDAMVRLSVVDDSEQKQFIDLPGTFVHGSKNGRIESKLPNSAISLSFPLDPELPNANIDLTISLNCWHEQDVRALSYLDLIAGFFQAISKKEFETGEKSVKIEIYINGNLMLACEGDQILTDRLRYFSPIVSILSKAKAVASDLKLSAIAPKDLNAQHAHEIRTVYDLWKTGSHSFPTPDASASGEMDYSKLMTVIEQYSEPAEIKTFQGGGFPFLGTHIDLGYQVIVLSAMSIDLDKCRIDESGPCKAVFKAAPYCIQTMRKCTDEELILLQPYIEQRDK